MRLIDTHCHFDMMPSPESFILKQESLGNTIIGMTNLPQHFQMGKSYVQRYKHIRLALGFHPLYAQSYRNQVPLFFEEINNTSYIGEIGLDFSKDGIATSNEQMELLKLLLSKLRGKKIISVHSRKAERELFSLLKLNHIENVIFHWYSGPLDLIKDIVEEGYYFSVNESMTLTKHGREIMKHIPNSRILTETDAPYNNHSSLSAIYGYLQNINVDIESNFQTLISKIRR